MLAAILLSAVMASGDEIFARRGFEAFRECVGNPQTEQFAQVLLDKDYSSFFGDFGEPSGFVYIEIGENEFASLRLEPRAVMETESILFGAHVRAPETIVFAVSRCSGVPVEDDPDLPMPMCFGIRIGSAEGIKLGAAYSVGAQDICWMEPGETYWLNLAFIDWDGGYSCQTSGGCSLFAVAQ